MDPKSHGHIANLFLKEVIDMMEQKIIRFDNDEIVVRDLIKKYQQKYPDTDNLDIYLWEAWVRSQAGMDRGRSED